MTYAQVHNLIMWPEATLSGLGLIMIPIDLRFSFLLLSFGAALHTTLMIALFTLPGGVEDDDD